MFIESLGFPKFWWEYVECIINRSPDGRNESLFTRFSWTKGRTWNNLWHISFVSIFFIKAKMWSILWDIVFCGICLSKGRILCNLCHIITFHTIFFSRGKKHEAFCGCCQTNQNALLELVSHFIWAAKQDWAVTGCLFGSLLPGKKCRFIFTLHIH